MGPNHPLKHLVSRLKQICQSGKADLALSICRLYLAQSSEHIFLAHPLSQHDPGYPTTIPQWRFRPVKISVKHTDQLHQRQSRKDPFLQLLVPIEKPHTGLP